MTDDSRSAITARREQVAAFDRPERLNAGFSIKDAVEHVRETPDLHKVYRPEWLIVFTSTAVGQAGAAEAGEFFQERYDERVHARDVRLRPASDQRPADFPWRLMLRLPNIKGEFKTRELAEEYVRQQGWEDAVIVARNSRDEFKIKEYGKKKLPRSSRA